jgi:hypothetical protein
MWGPPRRTATTVMTTTRLESRVQRERLGSFVPPPALPTWLLLHGPFDPSVGPLLQRLRERLARSGQPGQVLALSLPVLMGVLRWRLWLDAGGTRFALDAPGWQCTHPGPAVSPDAVAAGQVCGVINRLPDPMPAAGHSDGEYIASEWRALLCAWLHGLSEQGVPVVNRARPDALCGGGLSRTVWLARAAQLGLPVLDWAGQAGGAADASSPWAWGHDGGAGLGPPDLLLVGTRCLRLPASAGAQAWPRCWERPLRALAQQAECAVLGVHLQSGGAPEGASPWVISDASPCPDLGPWGLAAWDALGDAVGVPGRRRARLRRQLVLSP